MFAKKNSSKNGVDHSSILHAVTAVVLSFVLLVAAADLMMAHILADGLMFGTSGASLSVLAFVVTLTFLVKHAKACMGCGGCCGK